MSDTLTLHLSQQTAKYYEVLFRHEAIRWQKVAQVWKVRTEYEAAKLRRLASVLSHLSNGIADRCWEIAKYGHDAIDRSDKVSLNSVIYFSDEYRNLWRQFSF
ncbi:hypothetical protein [Terasakiella sp. SH-1]|uniref:hypothetical protein n=1 Tax=Terasakiella sp. SH-1 TaxID=2560057 RepID=UPI00107322C8|nr:hypothetical protein [Terasakiella sp. SH-1]